MPKIAPLTTAHEQASAGRNDGRPPARTATFVDCLKRAAGATGFDPADTFPIQDGCALGQTTASARLLQFDEVPPRIAQERLPGRGHTHRVADPVASRAQLGDAPVEVRNANCEMVLRGGRRERRVQHEMHLLTAKVEPRAVEFEHRPISTLGHAEMIDVERPSGHHLADGDVDVVDAKWSHVPTLCLRRYRERMDPDNALIEPTDAGFEAVAALYNALMTGLVLSLVTRHGEERAAEFVTAHFRRQHLEKFLPGLHKLGLATEPDAVGCALYHYHSNALGGVRTEYWRESDTKAWVRYPPPRWIWRGTAACGIPHSVNVAMLHGWHGHNGVSLGNPRLGFVCTATLTGGRSGLEGYYLDYGREIAVEERVRFVDDERMPRIALDEQPVLDTESWPEVRRRKTLRSYAMEYVRSMVPTLNELLGPLNASAELARVARLIGLQFQSELAFDAGGTGSAETFARWLAVMLASHGERVSVEQSPGGDLVTVTLHAWRLFNGVDLSDAELQSAFTAWNEIWIGAALSHDRFLAVWAVPQVASGCLDVVWTIGQ